MATNSINGVGLVTFGNSAGTTGLSFGRANALTIDNATNPPTVSVNGAPITGGGSSGLWRYFTGSNVDNTVQLDPAATGYDATAALLYPVANAEATGPPPFMLFEPDRGGAIRAGAPTGTVWTAANRGVSSVAFGAGSIAAGLQSVVSGGVGNSAAGAQSTIGGGSGNTVSAQAGTVGGGAGNSASGPYATVAGGDRNTASVQCASVVGGRQNTASGQFAVVCGGQNSQAQGSFATVSGGTGNIASGYASIVCGGRGNTATGSDSFSAGVSCVAEGNTSFAAGTGCHTYGVDTTSIGSNNYAGGQSSLCLGNAATNAIDDPVTDYWSNCFVWGDSSGLDLSKYSLGPTYHNTFNVRASGGVWFWTDTSATPSTGVSLDPNGATWNSLCDRNAKENFAELDTADILARVERLPLFAYNYKGADPGMVCRGPVAQDWHELFPSPAKNPLRIDTGDLDGITLAAVKGLAVEVRELQRRAANAEKEAAELKTQVAELRALVGELASR